MFEQFIVRHIDGSHSDYVAMTISVHEEVVAQSWFLPDDDDDRFLAQQRMYDEVQAKLYWLFPYDDPYVNKK